MPTISSDLVSVSEIVNRLPHLFIEIIGDHAHKVRSIAAPESATSDCAVFLATPKAFAVGLASPASVLVISPKQQVEAEALRGDRTLLIAKNVELAMAATIKEFFLRTPYTNQSISGIHPTAIISPDAEISPGVRIGPHAYIGSRVRLAKGVYIGAGSVIEDETDIDENTVIHPQVFIGHMTLIGKNCEIHPQSVIGKEGFGYAHDEKFNHFRIPHQGRVVLEDDVHIGACCTLDRGTFGETRIEKGAKFDNHIHIAHNCRVGRNSILTAGFTMGGSSRIGANFVTGGKTVVTGHVEVADNVQIAALSAVSKSITVPGQYGGNPLQPLQRFVKTKVAMTHLPEIQKQLKRIMKHLGLAEAPNTSKTES